LIYFSLTEQEHRIEFENRKKEQEQLIEQQDAIEDLKRQMEECQRELNQQVSNFCLFHVSLFTL